MCCKCARTKTMTKIKAEGTAWGVSKRAMHAGTVEFCLRGNKLIKINQFSFSIENKKGYF